MNQSNEQELTKLRNAAQSVTLDWSPRKATIAMRALGLTGDDRPSLDAIAEENGVSRETVRRARNELAATLDEHADELNIQSTHDLAGSSFATNSEVPATARALRRLLTMTGPLAWDKTLTAWARARGKAPYATLPSDIASMRRWAEVAGGFTITPPDKAHEEVTIAVTVAEELDHVGQFLFDVLHTHPRGVDRAVLLAAAETNGLKATTIATALSHHPAVIRLSRGTWGLRGVNNGLDSSARIASSPRKRERSRPTSFTWSADGSLMIEFSIPRAPSPVVAVPKAIAPLVEGREFTVEGGSKRAKITVGGARLWGFGSIVSEREMSGGQRARITLNLVDGTATLDAAMPENGRQ